MVGTTISVFLHRVGSNGLDTQFGISEKAGKWCQAASLGLFVGVNMFFYGFGNDFVSIIVLMQGVKLVYEKLG